MKYLIIFTTLLLFGCPKNDQVNNSKVIFNKNNHTAVANELICKRQVVSGSRRHVKVCLTKEQRDRERLESQQAIRNAADGRAKAQPNL